MDNYKKFRDFLDNKFKNEDFHDYIGNIKKAPRFLNYDKDEFLDDIVELASIIVEDKCFEPDLVKSLYKQLFTNKNYLEAFNIVLYEWLHTFVAITAKWDLFPNGLTRHFLVPIRNTIADLMYGLLGIVRTKYSQIANVNVSGTSFVLPMEAVALKDMEKLGDFDDEDEDEDDFTWFPASINKLFVFYTNTKHKTFYINYNGYNNYRFKCTFRKIKRITDESYSSNIIVEKATGYGILEKGEETLQKLYQFPESIELREITKNEGYPEAMDIFDAKLEDLRKNAEDYYYLMYYIHEEPGFITDGEDNNNIS